MKLFLKQYIFMTIHVLTKDFGLYSVGQGKPFKCLWKDHGMIYFSRRKNRNEIVTCCFRVRMFTINHGDKFTSSEDTRQEGSVMSRVGNE